MSAGLRVKAMDYASTPAEFDVKGILGAALAADWRQAFVARGLGYHVDVGAFSTPIVGGGNGTILDQDQPEFIISVASGYCVVPLRFHVACQVPLLNADSDESEILIAVDRAAAYDGTGTVTTETALNMRSNSTGNPTGVTCFSAATGNITNPTLGYELGHEVITADLQGIATSIWWGSLKLLYEPVNPPFLIGPCAIYGYWGGTVATSGFANLDFLAFSSSLVTGLS